MAIATTTAALIAAGASAARNVAASAIGSSAQNKATKKAMSQFETTQENLSPWRKAGEDALAQLTEKTLAGPGEFTESPRYQFILGQGEKALNRAAGTQGTQFSGAQKKSLMEYGTGLASQEFTNWLIDWQKTLAPLQALAGMGESAAANQASGAGALASLTDKQGQTSASGYYDIANSITGGLRDFLTLKEMGGSGWKPGDVSAGSMKIPAAIPKIDVPFANFSG